MAAKATEELPEKLREIKDDRSKALRAPKDIGDKAAPEADSVDDARTAVRYSAEAFGTDQFDVVTTRLSGFPVGKDSYSVQTQDTVAQWVGSNDPEIIDADEEEWSE